MSKAFDTVHFGIILNHLKASTLSSHIKRWLAGHRPTLTLAENQVNVPKGKARDTTRGVLSTFLLLSRTFRFQNDGIHRFSTCLSPVITSKLPKENLKPLFFDIIQISEKN